MIDFKRIMEMAKSVGMEDKLKDFMGRNNGKDFQKFMKGLTKVKEGLNQIGEQWVPGWPHEGEESPTRSEAAKSSKAAQPNKESDEK